MFCLPPAAVVLVPVLMQLGRGRWGCAVGSWGWWEGAGLATGLVQAGAGLCPRLPLPSLGTLLPSPSHGRSVSSPALAPSPGGTGALGSPCSLVLKACTVTLPVWALAVLLVVLAADPVPCWCLCSCPAVLRPQPGTGSCSGCCTCAAGWVVPHRLGRRAPGAGSPVPPQGSRPGAAPPCRRGQPLSRRCRLSQGKPGAARASVGWGQMCPEDRDTAPSGARGFTLSPATSLTALYHSV